MATRNLYDSQSVAATLLHSIQTNDRILLRATVHEFILSEEYEVCLSLLELGWFLSPPTNSRICYDSYIQTRRTNDIAWFVESITKIQSYSLPCLNYDIPQLPADTVSQKTYDNIMWIEYLNIPWSLNQKNIYVFAIDTCFKRKYWEHMSYLLNLLLDNIQILKKILAYYGADSIMLEVLDSTMFQPLLPRVLSHICAALVSPTEKIKKQNLPIKNTGRSFTISKKAAELWCVPKRSIIELTGVPKHICDTNATQYWKLLIKKFNIRIVGDSFMSSHDELLEQFYEEAFPIDIPDEWTIKEREKSHQEWDTNTGNHWRPAFLLCFS